LRYPAFEKAELLELVEQSRLPATRTPDKRTSSASRGPHCIGWYDRNRQGGLEALADHHPGRISSETAFGTMFRG
jgi:putative transposase